jgi:Bifunctional DNA primase/polymerase, N-terminal/Family of unknown function (DUF5906)/Primase C terminal 1 (PriCT-1)
MKVEIQNVNEMTKVEAALAYAASGVAIFPIVPNGKEPLVNGGFYAASTDIDVINGWWSRTPEANVGIRTGVANGIMVLDVDIKHGKNGEVSLNGMENKYGKLPKTRRHRTWSGGYHLLFSIGSVLVPSSRDKIGSGLDIRADGGYVVGPPSVVSGGVYVVENPDVPVADAPEWLVKLACEVKEKVERVACSGEIPEGGRNEHIFKFAIKCKKKGLSQDDALCRTLEENENCSPPLGNSEVVRTVASAYKYEVSEVPAEIEEMNKSHAAIFVGGSCYVMREIISTVTKQPDFELLSTRGFKEFYCNQYVQIDGKKAQLGDTWFHHPNRRQYTGLTFDPKETPEGYYNLWQGFAVEPKEGSCSLYLHHVKENIANGDKEVYDYIIGWMAHTVQNPHILLGTAIVLRGAMGVGKGVFAEQFGKLFGRHYMLLADSGQLTGRFNGHMKDKVVLFADEAFWAGDKEAEGKLKSMITEPTLAIESKGKDISTVNNHLHMIFATNNDWAAPAGPRERRFCIVDVGEKHLQDTEYFGAVVNQMNNGGREALLYYLMNYDVSNLNLRKFPQTKALMETKLLSFKPAEKFWHHILSTGYLSPGNENGWGSGIVETKYLHEKYLEFVKDTGLKHKATETELGINLSKLLGGTSFKKDRKTIDVLDLSKSSNSRGERKMCYSFPPLADCRKAFDTFVNGGMDWPTE